MSTLCYTFKNGPFKNALIKAGYDPRADKSALLLQFFVYQSKPNAKKSAFGNETEAFRTKGEFTRAKNVVQVLDCPDKTIVDYADRYIRTSRNLTFDVG